MNEDYVYKYSSFENKLNNLSHVTLTHTCNNFRNLDW